MTQYDVAVTHKPVDHAPGVVCMIGIDGTQLIPVGRYVLVPFSEYEDMIKAIVAMHAYLQAPTGWTRNGMVNLRELVNKAEEHVPHGG